MLTLGQTGVQLVDEHLLPGLSLEVSLRDKFIDLLDRPVIVLVREEGTEGLALFANGTLSI